MTVTYTCSRKSKYFLVRHFGGTLDNEEGCLIWDPDNGGYNVLSVLPDLRRSNSGKGSLVGISKSQHKHQGTKGSTHLHQMWNLKCLKHWYRATLGNLVFFVKWWPNFARFFSKFIEIHAQPSAFNK